MRIESYKEAGSVPENYLPSLVDAEIECWGSKPFNEYRICENEKCGEIYSIEDVYGSIEEYQNTAKSGNTIKNFKCLECSSNTKYIYEKNGFLELAKQYIKKRVNVVLMISKQECIRGFGVVVNTSVKDLLENEFNTRLGSYDSKKVLNLISKIIFNKKDASNENVVCFNHIFVGNELRKSGYGKIILNSMIDFLKGNENNPVFLETRKDCNGYILAKKMGFDELITDNHGYTIMFLGKSNCTYSRIIERLIYK